MCNLSLIGYRITKSAQLYGSKKKRIFLILSHIFIVSACCLVLTAYCLLSSCGKKGPPILKTSPPPSVSDRVDSDSGDTNPEKPHAE
jgi:hypothetical protein